MRYLANIDAMKLTSSVINDINKLDNTFNGKDGLYFHYLIEPSEVQEQMDFFIRSNFEIVADDPTLTLLIKPAVINTEEDDEPEEYCIIYKNFGLIFYTDWNEKVNTYPRHIGLEIESYLEGDNKYNGWLP